MPHIGVMAPAIQIQSFSGVTGHVVELLLCHTPHTMRARLMITIIRQKFFVVYPHTQFCNLMMRIPYEAEIVENLPQMLGINLHPNLCSATNVVSPTSWFHGLQCTRIGFPTSFTIFTLAGLVMAMVANSITN